MHKAFWDVLEEEIKAEPPQFKHAFDLLIEMKIVSSFLYSNHFLNQIALILTKDNCDCQVFIEKIMYVL